MKYFLFICSGLLLIALFDLPYGYYIFLRITVTIGAVAVVYNEYSSKWNFWVLIFALVTILFNPIFPVYLRDRSLWGVIDILCAIVFLIKGIKE